MAQAFAIPTGEVTKKVTIMGSAFGTGMLLGWIARTKPEMATMTSLLAGGVGVLGALMAPPGMIADLSLGVGSAAMGALGASIPAMFAAPARQISPGGSPRLLAAGTNVVGEAIASRVRSAVEF